MISLESVEQSILELERADTSFTVCDRLATLYIVRDHLRGYNVSPEAAIASEGASDFEKAINGKSPESVLPILTDLMESIQVLHPRMYEKALEEIREL